MASHVRGPLLGFRCNVETREIYRTSQLLSYLTGSFPQPNKAIVGRNAFAHEAGIHQHGMLQNGLTYEIIRPEMVGIPRSTLVLGKHSGRHALERRYRELGYDLTELQLAEVYRQFSALADRKREILDEDLLALVHESFHDAPEEYQLSHLRVVCGSVTPTAEVRMTGPWAGERSARGTGDGPIAAAFTAISEILGRPIEVLSLSLRSLTPGPRQRGPGVPPGQGRRQVAVGQRRLHRHRRGQRPGADPRAQQGAPRRPARGDLAQRHLPVGRVMAEQLTGAQILCRVLLEEGVDVLFGYPGGAIMPFYHALPEYPGAPPRAGAPRAGRGPRGRRLRPRAAAVRACAWRPRDRAPPTW